MKIILRNGEAFVSDDGHGHWVTIKGNKVKLDNDGTVLVGPKALKGQKINGKYKKVGRVYVFNDIDNYLEFEEEMQEKGKFYDSPTFIDNGWEIRCDGFYDVKRWQTALRRFEQEMVKLDKTDSIKGWIEGMRESCEAGYFTDLINYKSYPHNTPEEIKEAKETIEKGGSYSWGVEPVWNGERYYIWLNISGIYANREER